MSPPASSPQSSTLSAFRAGEIRGLGHPALLSFFQDLPRIADLSTAPDTTFYRQTGQHTNVVRELALPPDIVTPTLPYTRLVAKQFGWRGSQHYIFSPIKRSKAMKSYRTACHLLAHELATPQPLGVLEERQWGFIQYNVYLTEAITDAMPLGQYMAIMPDGPEGVDEVLARIATYTRCMHDSGLWHRDLVPGNFLIAGSPGNRRLYLVDLNRARRLPYLPLVLRAMDLARLAWRDRERQFATRYCGEDLPARRLVRFMRLYHVWRAWRRRIRQTIKPLRQWLRI